jgi:hypothetical protein
VGNRDGCSIRAGALAERQDGGKHLPAVVVRPFAEGTTIGPVAFGDRSAAGEDDQKPAKVERNDSTHRKEEKHEPTPHRLTVTPRAYATLPASLSGGTICRSPPSNKVVQRTAILIGIAFVLGLLGCEGGDEATSVERDTTTVFGVTTGTPDPTVLTREERVSHWIRSCEVREILFTHDHVAYIRFRDGERRRVPLGDEATADKVFATASEQPCPDFKIIVAIE